MVFLQFLLLSYLLSLFGFGIVLSGWSIGGAMKLLPTPTDKGTRAAFVWMITAWLLTTIILIVMEFLMVSPAVSVFGIVTLVVVSVIAGIAGACFDFLNLSEKS